MGINRLNIYAGLLRSARHSRQSGRRAESARAANTRFRWCSSIAICAATASSAIRSRPIPSVRGCRRSSARRSWSTASISLSRGRAAQISLPRSQRREWPLLSVVVERTASEIHQIGTDQGLLPAPVAVTHAAAGAGRARRPRGRLSRSIAARRLLLQSDAFGSCSFA